MLEFIQVATGKLPVKARFIIVVCTYCKRINKVSIIIIIILLLLLFDLPGFLNPSIVTGDKYRPDLLLTTKDNCLYILELTVGYETNLRNNIKRKQEKYTDVIKEQKKHFKSVEFINLSISALGVFDKESSAFLKMLNRLDVSETQTKYYIKKIINICIRSTYYIFCCRNKEWTNPDLMKF